MDILETQWFYAMFSKVPTTSIIQSHYSLLSSFIRNLQYSKNYSAKTRTNISMYSISLWSQRSL